MNTTDTVTETLAEACREADDRYRRLECDWRRIQLVTVLSTALGITLLFFASAPLLPALLIVAGVASAAIYIELVHRAARTAFKARCALAKYTGATEAEMAQLVNGCDETGGDVR